MTVSGAGEIFDNLLHHPYRSSHSIDMADAQKSKEDEPRTIVARRLGFISSSFQDGVD